MNTTPIDELRKQHPDQKRIDAETVRLLLATSPDGYAKKRQPREGLAHAIRLLDRPWFRR